MKPILLYLLLALPIFTTAQDLYFPPLFGDNWETMSTDELDYCQDSIQSLYNYLEDTETKAFLLLKDGKIVLEQYFDAFTRDSFWYWASAGKTLTATLTGIAQQEGFLNISDTSSQYLGMGWTSLSRENENDIQVYHQLSMTTGLDDSGDAFCTDPECLTYLAEPGSRWAYHNAPYTLLSSIIEEATATNYNTYTRRKILNPTGMDGFWLPVGYNRIFFSTARSMARFGLMILNEGGWDQTPILSDTTYFHEMVNPSQGLNNSYGYLWWLNGYSDFMIPGSQVVFPGPIVPSAPDDAIFGLGANGQMLAVMPSKNMVVIRMGNNPGGELVSLSYIQDLWRQIDQLSCAPTSLFHTYNEKLILYPQPAKNKLIIDADQEIGYIHIYDLHGHLMLTKDPFIENSIQIQDLMPGTYVLIAYLSDGQKLSKLLVKSP